MTQKLVSKAGTRAQKLAAIRPNIGRAILGGFVGTPAMSALMYTVAPLIGIRVDIADVLGTMLGGWTLGMIAHMINGSILFPLLYVLVAAHFLPGPPVGKGLAFGGGLWLVSQFVVMPMMGAGVFSNHLGPMAALASLLGHLVYGALLGSLAGDGEEVPVVTDYPLPGTGGFKPIYDYRCCTTAARRSAADSYQSVSMQQSQPADKSEDDQDQNSQKQSTGTSKDRLFFALPNFLTLETRQVPPLTTGQKFKVVTRSAFDYVEYPWYTFLAGISQAENSEPG
jgi:hypothetical protein